MSTYDDYQEELRKSAKALYEFCDNDAVKYRLASIIPNLITDAKVKEELHDTFLKSDIVEELYQTQEDDGSWGELFNKDYSVKRKIPNTATAIDRSVYIGLTYDDRDILFMANDLMESYLDGTEKIPIYGRNERALPWEIGGIVALAESIKPYNPLCDETYYNWKYIAERAFADGTYSYERERDAQHEVFKTRENRLVPMHFHLLLKRRDQISEKLEEDMLHKYGEEAYHQGNIWRESPKVLPEQFKNKYMSRWLKTFRYINQFRGTKEYLHHSVEWLLSMRGEDLLWDWGSQVKDPWGYFNYYSCSKHYAHNRIVDGSMEVVSFMQQYLDNNNDV